MAESFGPVYEVTHTVDREIIADFDAWLGQHIEEMLGIHGIFRAELFVADDHEDGRPRRVSSYHFDSDTDLEDYLAGPAEVMRESANNLFGGRFEVSRRVLHEKEVVGGELRPVESCLNCDNLLTGQYCGNCGQRAQNRLISLWQLLRDSFGDLLEVDSRLWRTLIPLTVRPGHLTRDYLEGRRARFMPPFRTYLVLSIVFFLVAFFDPKEQFGIFFDAETESPAAEDTNNTEDIANEVMQELVAEGVIIPAEDAEFLPPQTAADEESTMDAEGDPERNSFEVGSIAKIDFSGRAPSTDDNCDDIVAEDWPTWLPASFTPERVQAVCERVNADGGKAYLNVLLDSIPAALIALLPLMALMLKVLYPLSKRFYVEHVLFVVHFHAFFFLNLTLQILFSRLADAVSLPGAITPIVSITVSLYILVYLFKAMQCVYKQGWFATSIKFTALLAAYLGGVILIIATTAVLAAFSV